MSIVLESINFNILILLVIVVFAILFFLYYKKIYTKVYKYKFTVLVARLLIFITLSFLLINPTFLFNLNYKTNPKLNIFIDNSLSMSQQISNTNLNTLLDEFKILNNVDLKYFSFSNDVSNLDYLSSVKFNGTNTSFANLFDYISSLNNKSDILIISDGINNSPFNKKEFQLKNNIFTLGVGSIDTFDDDLEIEFLEIHNSESNDSLNILIRYNLCSDKEIFNHEVFLSNDIYNNYKFDKINIPKGKSFLEKKISSPISIFSKNNILHIQEMIGEDNISNNSFLFKLEDAYKKYNCMLVSGALSNNTKKIKNSIIRNFSDFILDHRFRISDNIWNKPFDDLDKTDVLILDNYPLTSNDFFKIQSLLKDFKGKMIYFLGPNSSQSIVNQFFSNINCIYSISKKEELVNENRIFFNNNFYIIPEYYSNFIVECNNENVLLYKPEDINNPYLYIFTPNLDELDKKSNIFIDQDVIEYINSNLEKYIYGREKKISIFLNNENKYENESIDVFVDLKDNLENSKLILKIQNKTENYKDVYADPIKISEKLYKFEVILKSSTYSLIVELKNKNNYSIESNEIILDINRYNQELENIYLDQGFLESISNENNGIYSHISQIESILPNLISNNDNIIKKYRRNILSYKYFLLILILLFSVEWYYRNKNGLL